MYKVILPSQSLVEARKKKGVSLREAAANIGISFGLLGKLERGEKQVGLKSAIGISRYYRIAMNRIVSRSNDGDNIVVGNGRKAAAK